MTDDGLEVLTFLPGTALTYPLPAWAWSDAVLVDAATRLEAIHRAGRDFDEVSPNAAVGSRWCVASTATDSTPARSRRRPSSASTSSPTSRRAVRPRARTVSALTSGATATTPPGSALSSTSSGSSGDCGHAQAHV
jgi:hypothetical protein